MRVLVTGGAGYVGSVACAHLLRQGHQVRVLDSLLFGGEPIASLYAADGFEFLRGDIRNERCVARAVDGMEGVVHLAAIVGDPACRRDEAYSSAVNLDASIQLLDHARRAGAARFVFASTCSNYGRTADPTQLVDEQAPLRPVSHYARTKVAVENHLLKQPAGERPATTILRFATVYGISPRMRFDLTVNEFARDLVASGLVTVYGEQFWRPYVHVRDAARAIATALEAPASLIAGEVFNVGDTEENFTKAQLVELVRQVVGGQTTVEHVPQADDPRSYRVDFSRIRRVLGFKVTRTVRDGIGEVVDALRKGVFVDPSAARYHN